MEPDYNTRKPSSEQGHRSKFRRTFGSSEHNLQLTAVAQAFTRERSPEAILVCRKSCKKRKKVVSSNRKFLFRRRAMSENGTVEQEEALMGGGTAATRPIWLYASNAHVWHKVAGVSGMAALALGTYGAHIFKPENVAYKEVWHTANLYHLVHTAALLGAPLTKRPHIFGGLLTVGIVLFSGSCYTTALTESRDWSLPAPFGGFAFIGAWASLLF